MRIDQTTERDENGRLVATPGQTVGPFYGYALPYEQDHRLIDPSRPGSIRLHGTVYDGAGAPIPDSLLEIWQPDAEGVVPRETGSLRRDGYTFTGFGRAEVDPTGHYTFTTVNPGPTEEGKAAFIHLVVFARGLLNKLHTRIYLPDDAPALDADPLLSSLDPERRATLVAGREDDGGLRFDVHLQGEGETVFLQFAGHDYPRRA